MCTLLLQTTTKLAISNHTNVGDAQVSDFQVVTSDTVLVSCCAWFFTVTALSGYGLRLCGCQVYVGLMHIDSSGPTISRVSGEHKARERLLLACYLKLLWTAGSSRPELITPSLTRSRDADFVLHGWQCVATSSASSERRAP